MKKPHVLISETTCIDHLRKIRSLGWGRMFCQRAITPFEGELHGFDNGAFLDWRAGSAFNEKRFISKYKEAQRFHAPYIAVTPDLVARGSESLAHSIAWRGRLNNWPWYLAVQDGMTVEGVRDALPLFSGIFLGGTDKFKLGAFKWCELAHSEGKPFHYARAGTITKLRHAIKIGADSIDSSFPLWTHARFDRFSAQWNYEEQQNELAFLELERREDVRLRAGGARYRVMHRLLGREGLPQGNLLAICGLHRSNDHMVTAARRLS